ncbi:tRNA-dihydrouridine(47) synthase [NAD(P)(+)]-like, partial [Cyrtonyx montezumae]|uniref:tRNA-dihydrouridine(47) synthase [NAD(P)(+)]-like n=1 Tax=Cyrtonyx montezumae TaxID=9017 RepID=UPI0032DA68A7
MAAVAPVRERFVASKEQFHASLRANGGGEPGSRGGGEEEEKEEKEAVSEQSEPPAKTGRLDAQGQDGEGQGEPEDGEKEPLLLEASCFSCQKTGTMFWRTGKSTGSTGCPTKTAGPVTEEDVVKLRSCEKKKLEIQGKLYLAPLTTCGKLPFRRTCKRFGADVTCGGMAVCTNLLQGQSSEWALLQRHHTEDIFGVQLEGAFPDTMTKCAELLNQTIDVDFADINAGCPIDLVSEKGGGCALMTRSNKFEQTVRGMNSVLDVPLTVKIRTGVQEKRNVAHQIIPRIREWGAATLTLHSRSREQRYTRVADWDYRAECAKIASPMPLCGSAKPCQPPAMQQPPLAAPLTVTPMATGAAEALPPG